jgi:hypothetical protein
MTIATASIAPRLTNVAQTFRGRLLVGTRSEPIALARTRHRRSSLLDGRAVLTANTVVPLGFAARFMVR